jgi:hypothetical protein
MRTESQLRVRVAAVWHIASPQLYQKLVNSPVSVPDIGKLASICKQYHQELPIIMLVNLGSFNSLIVYKFLVSILQYYYYRFRTF